MRQPVLFGKYVLLERISVGGMAEVFKARASGVEGFEKILAIKRILPSMAEDAEFIDMFVDEAKLCGQLSHANICQIYELGQVEDTHFIAMEYVWGKDLLQAQNRARKLRESIPPEMAAYVAMKVCEGLEYAHHKADQSGRPLGIIHRDVSPQNVLISYEGDIKIIDFGIARAATRASRTQAGVLKGKFGYMSPEQVRGLPIDRRTDIFSVGTLLYETLVGDRLFLGDSDFETLERVRNVDIDAPSKTNPGISPALERIVLKALARDVEDRYQWASEMQEDLQAFLNDREPSFGPRQLAQWLRAHFAAELTREQEQLGKLREAADALEAEARRGDRSRAAGRTPEPADDDEETLVGPRPGASRSRPAPSLETSDVPTPVRTPLVEESAPRVPLEASTVRLGEPAAEPGPTLTPEVGAQRADSEPTRTPPAKSGVRAPAAPAEADFDQTPTPPRELLGRARTPALEKPAVRWSLRELSGERTPEAKLPPPTASPVAAAPAGERAHARLGRSFARPESGTSTASAATSEPTAALPSRPPARRPRASHDLLVGIIGVALVIGGAALVRLYLGVRGSRASLVITVANGQPAELKIDGRERGHIDAGASLTFKDLLPGQHRVQVHAANGAESDQTVILAGGDAIVLPVSLKSPEAESDAHLRLRVQPEDAQVYVDGALLAARAWQTPLPLKAEVPHELLITAPRHQEEKIEIRLHAGEEVTRAVTLVLALARLRVLSDPPGAEVFLNGRKVGLTPMVARDLDASRPARLSVRAAGHEPVNRTVSFGRGLEQTVSVKLIASGPTEIEME